MNVQRFVRDGTLTLGSLGSARAVGLACRGHAAVPPLPGSRRLLREVSRPATPCAPLHTRAHPALRSGQAWVVCRRHLVCF